MTEACDGDIVMIDSSHVRVHQHGAAPPKKKKAGTADDSAMGRSRGGLTTKIHALVDAEGRPIKLGLSPGQDHDSTKALALLDDLGKDAILLADRAYDTDDIRRFVDQRGAWANVPPKSNRKDSFAFSQWVYPQRNLVERFFNKLKQFRGIATRYDRKAQNFLAAIKLVAVRLWLMCAPSGTNGERCAAPACLTCGNHESSPDSLAFQEGHAA